MLAQHLSTIALRSLVDLAKADHLTLPLKEIYWAAVFSLNWMVRDYSVTILRRDVYPHVVEREAAESEIRRLVSAVLWLVEQPLAADPQLIVGLRGLTFEWTSGREEIEAVALLTFIAELLWFRDPVGDSWSSLLDEWIERSATHIQTHLRQTAERLKAQSEIAFPGEAHHRVEHLSDLFAPELQMLHELWRVTLRCDFVEVDKLRSTLLPRLPAESWMESRIARILFDFHHATRGATAGFGDPQELGLTRRQLLTSGAKGHAVPEARDAHFADELAELLRAGPDAHKPANRFQCFRLAMLKEIFALREWDYGDWRESLQFQSACYLDAVRADRNLTAFATAGIRLAVAARNYQGTKDPLTRSSLIVLDRAAPDIREQLVRQLLHTHPLQCFDSLSALSDLSDAIPESMLHEVADWCAKFVIDVGEKLEKARGSTAAPLAFWCHILEYVDSTPALCQRLFPAFLKEAAGLMPWLGKGREVFEQFLSCAAQEQAVQILDALACTRSKDAEVDFEHWGLIFNALLRRPELRQERYIKFLREHATKPLRVHHLQRLDSNSSPGAFSQDAALSAWFRELIGKLETSSGVDRAPSPWFRLVRWTEHETDVIDRMIALADNPECSCMLVSSLVNNLAAIVSEADQSLLDHMHPTIERWLRQPPVGKNRNQLSPFSVTRNTEPDQNDVEDSLGRLADAVWDAQGWFPAVRPWIKRHAVAPSAAPLPFASVLACRAGLFSEEKEGVELLALGEGLVEYAFGKADYDPDWMVAFGRALSLLHQMLEGAGDMVKAPSIEPKFLQLVCFIGDLLPRTPLLEAPDVRAVAAKLTNWLLKNSDGCEYLGKTLELFRHDARARVRHYAK
jgi:hypothetical protein